jgi:hypothetical protein
MAAGEWRDPDVLDALAPVSTRIAVIEPGTVPLTLTVR